MSGEKTASQVIKEETLKSLWEQVSAEIPEWNAAIRKKASMRAITSAGRVNPC